MFAFNPPVFSKIVAGLVRKVCLVVGRFCTLAALFLLVPNAAS